MTSSPEITQCLAATLSSDTTTRISAELKLAELLVSPGPSSCYFCLEPFLTSAFDTSIAAGLALAGVIHAQNVEIALRQMSFSCFSFRGRDLDV
jgi:hypothetical protein